MQTARRLYLYLLSGVSLGVLVAGIGLLLTTLFDALGLAAGTPILDEDRALRERLTLASAMTVVSLPVWLIHWLAVERSVRPDRPGAEAERTSEVRGLYFAVAMGLLLIFAFTSAVSLIEAAVLALTGESLEFRQPANDLALLLSAGAAWAYHLWLRERDWSEGTVAGGAAALPRAYLYLAVLGGLLVALFGIVDLVGLLARVVFEAADQPQIGVSGPWWAFPLASAVARIVVGGATWLGHWWYAARVRADPGVRGRSERAARLRLAFFVAVLVVTAAATIGFLGQAMGTVIEVVLEASRDGGQVATDVLSSVLAAAVFAAAWWLHRRWLYTEDGEGTALWRLEAYPVSLVGLAYGAVASAWLLGLVIDVVFGGGRTIAGGSVWRQELASYLPFAVLGTALWLWQWSRVVKARAGDPTSEADSTVRRAVLLIVLAMSVLAGIAALGVILYRVFGSLFGLDAPGDVVAELSTPIASLAVAAAVALYHGAALRRDQRERTPEVEAERPTAVVHLRLIGPPDAGADDVDRVARGLGEGLPSGYRIEADRRMS